MQEKIRKGQPTGYVTRGKESSVRTFNKILYDLKQAARSWNKKLNDALAQMFFNMLLIDHSTKQQYGKWIYRFDYVDYMTIIGVEERHATGTEEV